MAIKRFFNGPYEVQLAKEIIANDPLVYIQMFEYIGTGVYAYTSNASTLTPATSPTWVADAYISSGAYNLWLVDDNGKAGKAKIADNDADSVTFDETACLLEEDEATVATLTATNTYNMYIASPSSNTYGQFWGETKGWELNINEETKDFVSRDPAGTLYSDLASQTIDLNVGYVHVCNEDLHALTGRDTYGSQTSQAQFGLGPKHLANKFARLTFLGQDNDGKNHIITLRKVKFYHTGNLLGKGDSGHREYSLMGKVLLDTFIEERDSQYGSIITAD